MEQQEAGSPSIAYRDFTFEDRRNPQESLRVSIPEVLDPQYGMYVWPCAAVLAQYLWTHREELRGKTVLELVLGLCGLASAVVVVQSQSGKQQLGAGVSLPGVVAARCGAQVILSDAPDRPLCLQNCRRSCDANGLGDVAVLGLTWGQVSPDLVLLPRLDVVLGSDVFYEPEDFEDVLVTAAFLLNKNPSAQFWTTYQVRSADWSMEALLHRWRLRCVHVQLHCFDADRSQLAGSTLPGRHSVQMMIITLRTQDLNDPG